jgi:hypothetical protein
MDKTKTTESPKKPDYVLKGHKNKIEVSLRDQKHKEGDKYLLEKAEYYSTPFSCDHCGHSPALFRLIIKDLGNNKKIAVGSECIKSFSKEGIDAKEAVKRKKILKRQMRKARKVAKEALKTGLYDSFLKEEKSDIIIRLSSDIINGTFKKEEWPIDNSLTKEDVWGKLGITESPKHIPTKKELKAENKQKDTEKPKKAPAKPKNEVKKEVDVEVKDTKETEGSSLNLTLDDIDDDSLLAVHHS